MPHLIIRFTSFSFLLFMLHKTYIFFFSWGFNMHFPNYFFFYVKNSVFYVPCYAAIHTLKNSCCCNTIKMRKYFKRRMNFMLCTIGFTRSTLEFPACMLVFFALDWSIKIFNVSLNERLAIKYVYAIIIKGSRNNHRTPLFLFLHGMYDLLLELCFRVDDKNTKKNIFKSQYKKKKKI